MPPLLNELSQAAIAPKLGSKTLMLSSRFVVETSCKRLVRCCHPQPVHWEKAEATVVSKPMHAIMPTFRDLKGRVSQREVRFTQAGTELPDGAVPPVDCVGQASLNQPAAARPTGARAAETP